MRKKVNRNKESETKFFSLLNEYCKIVEQGFLERWKKLPVELFNSECYEVIGGLLARQATLSIQLARSPDVWNGHIAPLFLRCMTDAHITLAWILGSPEERTKQYILYGLGQEKLHIEHLKADPEANSEDAQRLIQIKEDWLNSQRHDFLTEVNVGNWAGLDTRDMAKKAGCESLYKYAYAPFSGVAHNMWQHVSRYNLKFCSNALHKYHKVPTIVDCSSDLDYLYRSAKYVEKSYRVCDEKFQLKINTPMPQHWFLENFMSESKRT